MSTLVSASSDASLPFPFYACFSALFLMRDKHNRRSFKSMLGEGLGEGFRVACHIGEEDNAIR
jgi:3-deoxy-D-manno-octulosonic acid (KDO) 8-phosphate synthase